MYVRLIQTLSIMKGERFCYQGFKKRTKKNKNEKIKSDFGQKSSLLSF